MASKNDIQHVATELHNMFCGRNHTDGCGWFYSTWDVLCLARNKWFEKARKSLDLVDGKTLLSLAVILK